MTIDTNADRKPLKSSRAEQTLAKKQRVLDVARDQFVRQGYRAVTMEMIALVSGVSKRSLYLWHTDKPALFKACLVDGALRFPLLRFDPNADVEEDLMGFRAALLIELGRPNSVGFGALLIREAREFPQLAEMARRYREQYLVQPLADYLYQAGLADNTGREAADLFTSLLLAPIHHHLLLGHVLPDDTTLASHANTATRLFVWGQSGRVRSKKEDRDARI